MRAGWGALAAVLAAAGTAQAAHPRALPGARFVAKSAEAQLFSVAVKGKGAVKRRYFGCRTGHTPLLLTADITPKSTQDTTYANSAFRIGGTWAAWVETTSSDAGAGEFSRAIHVRSLAGVERAVDVFTNAGAGGYRSIDVLKVGSDGAVAFVLTALDGAVEVDGV